MQSYAYAYPHEPLPSTIHPATTTLKDVAVWPLSRVCRQCQFTHLPFCPPKLLQHHGVRVRKRTHRGCSVRKAVLPRDDASAGCTREGPWLNFARRQHVCLARSVMEKHMCCCFMCWNTAAAVRTLPHHTSRGCQIATHRHQQARPPGI
jgi:hypothetical protein